MSLLLFVGLAAAAATAGAGAGRAAGAGAGAGRAVATVEAAAAGVAARQGLERGLLGFCFHPKLVVDSSRKPGRNVVCSKLDPVYADYRRKHKDAGPATQVLLDVRPYEDFRSCHHTHSTSIPGKELAGRLYELPPPYDDDELVLFGREGEVAEARGLLTSKGWKVAAAISSEGTEIAHELREEGASSRPVWRPTPLLQEVLSSDLAADLRGNQPQQRVAFDVGCGAGRDLAFMALTLGGTWRVIGFDNDAGALERAERLAEREDVEVTTSRLDLRKDGLGEQKVDLILGSRFLHRPLFHQVFEGMLRPGGLLVWSTFLQGSSLVRPGRSLRAGELRDQFAEAGYEILLDREDKLYTGGQWIPSNSFVARAPRG